MCIIVFDDRAPGKRLDRDVLKRCQETNPHGMGVMWSNLRHLKVWHSMDDFDGIWQRYCSARNAGYPVAVHFRVTTHGESSVENCHPFIVEPGEVAFMHNGTFTSVLRHLPKDSKLSDTAYFNEHILKLLPVDWMDEPLLIEAVDRMAGDSRILAMNKLGETITFNKHKGFTHDGVWFSHDRTKHYLLTGAKLEPTAKPIRTTPTIGYGYGGWDDDLDDFDVPARPSGKALAPSKKAGEDAGRHTILLFDHIGTARYHTGFLEYFDDAKLKSHRLWAVDDGPESMMPVIEKVPLNDTFGVYGRLAVIRAPNVIEALAEAEVLLDASSASGVDTILNFVPVHCIKKNRILSAYVGITDTKKMDQSNLLYPVPYGDWWKWDNPYKYYDPSYFGSDEPATLDLTPLNDDTPTICIDDSCQLPERDKYECPECKETYTIAYFAYPSTKSKQKQHMLWCYACTRQYPVSPIEART